MVLALVDTGACRTIIDTRTARECSLEVIKAVNGNFGSYATPGCSATDYYGVVRGPVKFQLSPEIILELPFVRVIEHPHCLILLGAEILRPGKEEDQWSFNGVINETHGKNQVSSYLMFQKAHHRAAARLLSCPVGDRQPFRISGVTSLPNFS
jgi:hypothetical protein